MIRKLPEVATQTSKAKKIERWIQTTPRKDVERFRDLAIKKYPPKANPILITVDYDGFIEVYSNQRYVVTILNLPETDSKESEIVREQMVGNALPHYLREVYFPGSNLIKTGNIRKITMADIQRIEGNFNELYSFYSPDENRRCGTTRKMTLAAMEA